MYSCRLQGEPQIVGLMLQSTEMSLVQLLSPVVICQLRCHACVHHEFALVVEALLSCQQPGLNSADTKQGLSVTRSGSLPTGWYVTSASYHRKNDCISAGLYEQCGRLCWSCEEVLTRLSGCCSPGLSADASGTCMPRAAGQLVRVCVRVSLGHRFPSAVQTQQNGGAVQHAAGLRVSASELELHTRRLSYRSCPIRKHPHGAQAACLCQPQISRKQCERGSNVSLAYWFQAINVCLATRFV